MSKASNVHYAARLAGILVLAAGTTALATEEPDCDFEDDREGMEVLETFAPGGDGRVDSAQQRSLNLMLMIWTLNNNSSDIK